MKRLIIVDISVRLVFHAVLVVSVYLLLAGHNQPGGGFVAGLLVGAAIAMRYAAGGIDEVRSMSRFAPWTILGTGLLVSGLAALAPIAAGEPVLEASAATLDIPALGQVKVTSALVFDAGVYLLVIGLVLMVFEAFGGDPTLDEGEGSRA